MKGKIALLVGGAAGYVLGARAGRERYEEITSQARSIWQSPAVQEKATQAQDFAKQKAPILKDKVAGAAPGSASGGQSGGQSSGQSDAPSGDTGPVSSAESQAGSQDHPAPYPTSATTGLN
jgi:hypothetical protein